MITRDESGAELDVLQSYYDRAEPPAPHALAEIRLQVLTRVATSAARRPSHRPLAFAAAGAVTLAVTGGAVAAAKLSSQPASFAVGAEALYPGDPLGLKGSGCRPAGAVTFTLDGTTRLGTATATSEGHFSPQLPLPADTKPGWHEVSASCAADNGEDLVQKAGFQLLGTKPPLGPALEASGEAAAGGTVVVKGAGCRVGGSVGFALDGRALLGKVTAGADTVFTFDLPIPAATRLGTHTLTATCIGVDGTSLLQKATVTVIAKQRPPDATFAVEPSANLKVGTVARGGEVRVKGSGCRAGSRATFTLGGTPLATSVNATAQTGFDAVLRIPLQTDLGPQTISAACVGTDGKRLHLKVVVIVVRPG
jgi:hypothetical protein